MSLIIWPFVAFLISAFFYFGNIALDFLSESWRLNARRVLAIHFTTGFFLVATAILWLIGSVIVLLQHWAERSPPLETSTVTL